MSIHEEIDHGWMSALAELSVRLSGSITRDQAVAAVVTGARDVTGALQAAYAEVRGDEVQLRVEAGVRPMLREFLDEVGIARDWPMADAARTGRMVHVADRAELEDRYPEVVDLAESTGVVAVTNLPVSIGGRVGGVLHLGYGSAHPLSPGECEFLAALASLAGQSIESAEAIERESRVALALAEVEAEAQVAELVYTEARDLFGADRVALHLADPVSGDLVLAGHPSGEALFDRIAPDAVTASTEAFWSGKPVVVESREDYLRRYPGIEADRKDRVPGAGLSVPLRFRGRSIGTLSFGFAAARKFQERDVTLAQILGDASAAALERLRLSRQERRATERQAAVARIARFILEAESAEAIAATVLAALGQVENCRSGAVYLHESGAAEAELLAADGWSEATRRRFARVSVAADSALAAAIVRGHPLYVERADDYVAAHPATADVYRAERLEASAILPLQTGAMTNGAITIGFGEPRSFDTEARNFLEAVAATAAQGLGRLRAQQAERRTRDLLEGIVAQMPVGIRILSPEGAVIASNAPAIEPWRGDRAVQSVEDYPNWPTFHPDGRPYAIAERPAVRALGGETVVDEEVVIRRFDDTTGVLSVSAAPVKDASGRIVAAVVVSTDITDRKDRENSRDAFMAVLSHELRTPMTSIAAATRLLQSRAETMDRATVDGLYGDIAAETARLNRIVENLMVLSRIELATMRPTGEPLMLDRLLPRLVAAEQALWPECDFDLRVESHLPVVHGDPGYVEQVMRNLLSNAAKYAPGEIEVEVAREPGRPEVSIAVRDHGSGIAPEEVDHLFELFWRSPGHSGRAPGAGVGLFVVRKLVESMAGRIWLDTTVADGARFVVSLTTVEDVVEPVAG